MKTEAQRRAAQKYRKSEKFNYTSISAGMTKTQAETCRSYAEKLGITPSRFAVNSMFYCIKNNITFDEDENKADPE